MRNSKKDMLLQLFRNFVVFEIEPCPKHFSQYKIQIFCHISVLAAEKLDLFELVSFD